MSAYSDKYNALPDDLRQILNGLMIEAEIRVIELEKRRILQEAQRAVDAHNERIKRMRHTLKLLGMKP